MKYLGAALVAISLVCSASAHHSVIHFDTDREVALQGTVLEYEFKNPHVYFRVRATDESGEVQDWEVEGQGISLLAPRGLSANSAKPGDVVSFIANPNRNLGSRLMNGLMVTLADGQSIALHSVTSSAEIAERTNLDRGVDSTAANIFGAWLPRNLAYLQLFQREHWVLTDKGKEMLESFDGSQIPQSDCVAVPPPRLTLWPVIHEIELGENVVTIRSDWMEAERIVHIGGAIPRTASLRYSGTRLVDGKARRSSLIRFTSPRQQPVSPWVSVLASKNT